MSEANWRYSAQHNQLCLVLEEQTLWGDASCRVWLPQQDAVVRVRAEHLQSLNQVKLTSAEWLAYITAAARVADALAQNILLAPLEANVIPLPHQIKALQRAVAHDRVRYLLADEVGLGKTIEAGLIMRELKLRGLVKRTLVVTPRGIAQQWVAEMQTHFGEEFRLLFPGDFEAYKHLAQEKNIWRAWNQIICTMDSVKPMEGRRGWSWKKIADYNQDRFDDLITAGWDLVIIDEAHRLGGSHEDVARFKLGQGLAESAPYFLMLSATPHQGKTDGFHRLVSLLDGEAFPDVASVTRERVQPYVIRTEKRQAIDAEGKPLFMPRKTQLISVSWQSKHARQKLLYEAVTEYVREGYNQAMREKKNYIGFLMLLMQRLVASSTRAIRSTLERRLEILKSPTEQMLLFSTELEEDWEDFDSQDQLESLLKTRLQALKNEHSEVKLLLEAARHCENTEVDAKAETLLEWIYKLQQEENDPSLKVLIFTEFVATQELLDHFLRERGFSVVTLNGSMDMASRQQVQASFTGDTRILISTDAGGEGLNLQFCHVVVNYDIPWNPMKLEQRIGRVDRIGQKHVVRAINFVIEDTVEYRVREVLEQKLAVIQQEFGIDKTADVLDSAQANQIFDALYRDALLHPESLNTRVDGLFQQIKEQTQVIRDALAILGQTRDLNPQEAKAVLTNPVGDWVERMTVFYLKSHGGKAEQEKGWWNLVWPSGETMLRAVFSGKEVESGATVHLTLEDSKILAVAAHLPRFVSAQPIPVIVLQSVPGDVTGVWSLWRIALCAEDWNRQRIMPLFIHDDGRCLVPTARYIWDQLLTVLPEIPQYCSSNVAAKLFQSSVDAAQTQGRALHDRLVQEHRAWILKEREKGEYAFAARRRAIERIGLPEVRQHRLHLLAQDQQVWQKKIETQIQAIPELFPIAMLYIKGGKP